MIVMGIDPGIARAGWGVISKNKGVIRLMNFGCIETPKTNKEEMRLTSLFNQLNTLIKKHKPDELAIEKLFFTTNAKTAFMVGQGRGIALLLAGLHDIPVGSYTPLEVKLAITGYGKADKRQMQKMVQSMLKLTVMPKPDDAADALGIAITHCYSRKVRKV